MQNLASKSALIRTEKQLIQKTVDLGRELRGSIKDLCDSVKAQGEQIGALALAMANQGNELRAEFKEQGNELRAEIREQGNEFRCAMEKQS
ncbi:hypothetical protein HX866_06130, partial [Pseudomonas gingeri]|nr:hypothetical protein [Pseudomonas gingeri]